MWGRKFTLVADGKGGFELLQSKYDIAFKGRVGQTIAQETPEGKVEILVTKLDANPVRSFCCSGIQD